MAHFAAEMLAIAVELAGHDPVYEDMARKFFEHYLAIVTAIKKDAVDGVITQVPAPDGRITVE